MRFFALGRVFYTLLKAFSFSFASALFYISATVAKFVIAQSVARKIR